MEENELEAETAETGYLSIAGLEEWSEDEVKIEDTESGEAVGSTDADYVTVQVEPDRFVMVTLEYDTCSEPCDSCFYHQCAINPCERHFTHECHVCRSEHEKLVAAATATKATKEAVRNELKWRRPEGFHYLVDKTICLFKGITHGRFNSMKNEDEDKLRQVHGPLMMSRENNAETLKQLEKSR